MKLYLHNSLSQDTRSATSLIKFFTASNETGYPKKLPSGQVGFDLILLIRLGEQNNMFYL